MKNTNETVLSKFGHKGNRKGYRCEWVYGSDVTDPILVAIHETKELFNTDLIEWLIHNADNITETERQVLRSFTCAAINESYAECLKYENSYHTILERYLGNRNFCKWLCPTPEDVKRIYSGEYFNINDNDITEYIIPDNAIVLSDLAGNEGTLIAWRKS